MRTVDAVLGTTIISTVCRNEATLWKRWEHPSRMRLILISFTKVGMKPLSERDENPSSSRRRHLVSYEVGMKPLSERDENVSSEKNNPSLIKLSRNEATLWKRWEPVEYPSGFLAEVFLVGMKPLSERDENLPLLFRHLKMWLRRRNEATLWKRWEP